MQTYVLTVVMDDLGDLLSVGVALGMGKPLLVYDKSFIGTRSKNGVVSSPKAKEFMEEPRNYPQSVKIMMALEILGLPGAADGLREYYDLLYTRPQKKDAERR